MIKKVYLLLTLLLLTVCSTYAQQIGKANKVVSTLTYTYMGFSKDISSPIDSYGQVKIMLVFSKVNANNSTITIKYPNNNESVLNIVKVERMKAGDLLYFNRYETIQPLNNSKWFVYLYSDFAVLFDGNQAIWFYN